MGARRGRLAVALDLLTDALAMVGQHGVYCQSARMPGQAGDGHRHRPRADRRREGAAAERDRARTTGMNHDALAPIGVIAHYNLLERLDPAGSGELYRARDTKHGRTVAVRAAARRLHVAIPHRSIDERPRRSGAVASERHHRVRRRRARRPRLPRLRVPEGPVAALRDGRTTDERPPRCRDGDPDGGRRRRGARGRFRARRSEPRLRSSITAKGNAKIPAFDLAVQGGLEYADGQARLHDYDSPEEARGAGGRRPVRHLLGRRDSLRDADDAAADASRRVGAERVESARVEGARRHRA